MRLLTFLYFLLCPFSVSILAATDSATTPFQPFTGRIKKERVRLRLQPSLDAHIVRELKAGELLLILDENDDFYAVQPPEEIKGYIYRSFVLDDTVEGSHVNVRLAPLLEAPIIAQLNTGDRVKGHIALEAPKWLEIELPPMSRLFVSSHYIEQVGDADFLGSISRRQREVEQVVLALDSKLADELTKPFEEMQIEEIAELYRSLAGHYADFPREVAHAEGVLKGLQEVYLERKLAYLEEQALRPPLPSTSFPVMEEQLQQELSPKMAHWLEVERAHYAKVRAQEGERTEEEWRESERRGAFTLQGVIRPYTTLVTNKPGDYLLVTNQGRPIAYLYSAAIPLEDYLGRSVSLSAVPRPNHGFALPAYSVFSID